MCFVLLLVFLSLRHVILQCTTKNSKSNSAGTSSHTNPFLVANSSVNSYGNLASGHQKPSSSPRQQPQQQILLPKELIPSVSTVGLPPSQSVYDVQRQQNPTRSNHPNNKPRPIKLPLRKHHSFHFQPSQTVAGSNQEKSYLKNYYKANGPLVFKPIKPVPPTTTGNNTCQPNSSSTSSTPSPTHPNTMSSLSSPPSTASTLTMANTQNLSHTSPRICGTRLKRHHSNVEPGNNNPGNHFEDVQGIHTISNGSTALGVYDTLSGRGGNGGWESGGGGIGRRLHYVELDENFGQEHTRARREARHRARPVERGLSYLSDDEGLKRRSRSAAGTKTQLGSDYEVEGYLTGGEGDVQGLVFGAFEEDRLNLKHFKDKYFFQTPTVSDTGRNAAKSDTQEHPQQLKSHADHPKRTQYATLKFNEVNI